MTSIEVSILVVLDHWFGPNAVRRIRSPSDVSILVVLDHWFGPRRLTALQPKRYVSILVVLDHWFGRTLVATAPTAATTRFNPCCFGSLVRA